MVIDNFNAPCFATTPNEADPPLNVDPDTVLALPVAGWRLQTISRRDPQILQSLRGIDDLQLCPRPTLNLARDALDGTADEDGCGALVSKTPDHDTSVPFFGTLVNMNAYRRPIRQRNAVW
jgi:hypothetical protein